MDSNKHRASGRMQSPGYIIFERLHNVDHGGDCAHGKTKQTQNHQQDVLNAEQRPSTRPHGDAIDFIIRHQLQHRREYEGEGRAAQCANQGYHEWEMRDYGGHNNCKYNPKALVMQAIQDEKAVCNKPRAAQAFNFCILTKLKSKQAATIVNNVAKAWRRGNSHHKNFSRQGKSASNIQVLFKIMEYKNNLLCWVPLYA